jgi:hypothetical protein
VKVVASKMNWYYVPDKPKSRGRPRSRSAATTTTTMMIMIMRMMTTTMIVFEPFWNDTVNDVVAYRSESYNVAGWNDEAVGDDNSSNNWKIVIPSNIKFIEQYKLYYRKTSRATILIVSSVHTILSLNIIMYILNSASRQCAEVMGGFKMMQ